MPQQAVVGRHRRQVVPPGVAVALREEDPGVELVDVAVEVLVGDVVGQRVGDLAVARGEVPEEPVVDRPRRSVGVRVVATAQQRELLVEQRIELVLEGEDGRRERAVDVAAGAEADHRVLGVGVGLVAEQGVEVGDPRRDEEQRLVGRRVVDRRRAVDRQVACRGRSTVV